MESRENFPGRGVAGQLDGHRFRHHGQKGRHQQQLPRRLVEFLKYFSRQVIEYELWRRCHRQSSGRAGNGRLVEHEDESRRPPLCLLVYLTETGVVDVGAPELDDGVGLIPR